MTMKKTPLHTTAQRLLPLSLLFISSIALAAGSHDQMDHSQMDHANMDHGTMNHSTMNHADMDHSNMDHGAMISQVGMPAPTAQATQTYRVTLTDDMRMQFSPHLSIKQGDIVKFIITNNGNMPHEFSIGSLDEQKKHRDIMKTMPDMVHNDGTTLTLAPGETAEMGWHFMGLNFVEFSCNITGHSDAGMKRNTVLR